MPKRRGVVELAHRHQTFTGDVAALAEVGIGELPELAHMLDPSVCDAALTLAE